MKFHFLPSRRPDGIDLSDWNDWVWQLRQSISRPSQIHYGKQWWPNGLDLKPFSDLSFPFRVTPYYLSLIGDRVEHDPIAKIIFPSIKEKDDGGQQLLDPLGEKKNSPVPRIIHRYSDRVLFLVTDFCSVYCRYCTRKHFTGQSEVFPTEQEYHAALDYVRNHQGIREVILSGGDPLTLSNSQIEKVLADLRGLDHIEIIRIGTRMPVVCPMRVDDALVGILRKYKPVFIMTHFNHPRELTSEAASSLEKLVDHGVPVFNQMVLLRGINNHPAVVQALNRRLLYLRVKPYYMFQCDPSFGTEHFRTSIEEGEWILRSLWGHLSGLAMPIFSLDIPNGGGKVTLVPNFEVDRSERGRCYEGWDGVREWYLNPVSDGLGPCDYSEYQREWEMIQNAKC